MHCEALALKHKITSDHNVTFAFSLSLMVFIHQIQMLLKFVPFLDKSFTRSFAIFNDDFVLINNLMSFHMKHVVLINSQMAKMVILE